MYTYSTFVATTLPTARPRPNVGTGAVRSDAILLPSGTIFDPTGSAQKRRGIYTIQYPCMVKATTAAAAHTAYQALRALLGVYGKLYRKLHDATTQWLYCRLLDVMATREPDHRFTQPLTLVWETRQEVWHGALNQDSYAFDASPLSKEINNAGDAIQRHMTITITAQGSAITVLGIANAESGHVSDFHYANATGIAATKSLVIDTGAWSVLNDGDDAWDDIAFQSGHAIDGFLRFLTGNNTVTFHRTGGDNTSGIQVDHYDAYA